LFRQVKKNPASVSGCGVFGSFFSFACLDHNPAVPDYENENNEAKEYDDRVAHGRIEPRGFRHGPSRQSMCVAVVHERYQAIQGLGRILITMFSIKSTKNFAMPHAPGQYSLQCANYCRRHTLYMQIGKFDEETQSAGTLQRRR
jgi:hypothetical protein